MSHSLLTFVFATATSRLHADIIISRLKQAGVPLDLISALFMPKVQPNSALCWLNGTATRPTTSGEKVCISGQLRFKLGDHHRQGEPLATRLTVLGLAPTQSLAVEQTLLENEIVLCVQADSGEELSVIFRTLKETAAEKVLVAETEVTRAVAASEWGLSRVPPRPAGRPAAIHLCSPA